MFAEFHPQLCGRDFRCRLSVEAVRQPFSVWTRSIRTNVFLHPDFHSDMVTYTLLLIKALLVAIGTAMGPSISLENPCLPVLCRLGRFMVGLKRRYWAFKTSIIC